MARTSTFAAVMAVAALAAFVAFAQAPTGSGVVALTGARIVDGTGRAPVQNRFASC